MSPARVALWAYHVIDPNDGLDKAQENTLLTLKRGELSHHWTTGLTSSHAETPYGQTRAIFQKCDAAMQARNMSVADNLIRTWLFVRDIDANYNGLVEARREFFAEHGLTPHTHYIASSGIGGVCADAAATIAMDAYAIANVRPEQIEFIRAPDQLSPTHVYGVTFERATSVTYRDRKHVMISGTASIDHQGGILHPGDVARQLDRTLENMQALLERAGATLEDMCVFIAYVRHASDLAVVRQQMGDRFGDAPIAVVVAPVCRPEWLVELEGQAIVPARHPELPPF
jgi:enamine deaminase RidA (YjgF/YER057c/UK114 family)